MVIYVCECKVFLLYVSLSFCQVCPADEWEPECVRTAKLSFRYEKKAICLRREKKTHVKEKFVPIKRKAICTFGTIARTQAYTVPHT